MNKLHHRRFIQWIIEPSQFDWMKPTIIELGEWEWKKRNCMEREKEKEREKDSKRKGKRRKYHHINFWKGKSDWNLPFELKNERMREKKREWMKKRERKRAKGQSVVASRSSELSLFSYLLPPSREDHSFFLINDASKDKICWKLIHTKKSRYILEKSRYNSIPLLGTQDTILW